MRAACLLPFLILCNACSQPDDAPPLPFGALPSDAQLQWQQMEYYMFAHFGPNTFTDVEWGDGKEDPRVFNPTDLDCRQWASTAKAAGMTGIIITAKHHDGFCLWPSQHSKHTVRESLWLGGKGDVLAMLSEACREAGLAFGVYISPWDQNHPAYGSPAYNQVFANTLDEALGNYGPVFEQWLDGANGDANKGQLKQQYDWKLFHQTIFSKQPGIIIFSDIGPGCRWMGNERGVAGETNWSRLNTDGFEPGLGSPPRDTLEQGNRYGRQWIPAETDVSIRPGWFYSPSTDDKVKSVEQLMDIYYTSVGRNSNLLLNVPPDRRGRIHPIDSARLIQFREAREKAFAHNLLTTQASVSSKQSRRGKAFSASNIADGNYHTYWAAADGALTATIDIALSSPATFNRLLIQEYIPLGQRVSSFNIEAADESGTSWNPVAEGTTIGYKRILRFDPVTARRLRINITGALAGPVISSAELYMDHQ
jgi:alpha-L-fucosidase